MEFRVAKDVLGAGVKILFDVIEGIDNATPSEEWDSFRDEKIKELLSAIRTWTFIKSKRLHDCVL